uniref:Pre-mRNA-splicing factor 38B n=1 Tax=Ursus americanus TaxID=9643 RepID=A0A452SF28_URSAM
MANNSPALTGNSQPQHQAAAAAAQQQQQCGGGGGGATKPAVSGKQGNVLPLWGNEKTMNLNPMILTNILSSPYFKVQLYELKTYHEVVDEIYFKFTALKLFLLTWIYSAPTCWCFSRSPWARACIDFNVGLVLLVFSIRSRQGNGQCVCRVGVGGLRVERCQGRRCTEGLEIFPAGSQE